MTNTVEYGATREEVKQAMKRIKGKEVVAAVTQKVSRRGIKLNNQYFYNEIIHLYFGQKVKCLIYDNRVMVFNQNDEEITTFEL